jgi:hypothetical protein
VKSDEELLLELLKDAEEAVMSTLPQWYTDIVKKSEK